jgi:beta-lactam-binding protein with PASTA domain
MSQDKQVGAGASWGAILKSWVLPVVRFLVPVALALVAAGLLFNLVIMPGFVHHGEEVEVPDVRGESLDRAREILAEAALAVRDTTGRTDGLIPAGEVIDQNPRPGSSIKHGRGLALLVSLGLQEQRVPQITGQTLRFARLTLSQEGYGLGDVLRIPTTQVTRNFVMACDPAPGTLCRRGERVNLLVSDGPEAPTWIMPDLRGQELRLTADKLRFAGFEVIIDQEEAGGFSLLRVVATDPPAGLPVRRTDTIRLIGG